MYSIAESSPINYFEKDYVIEDAKEVTADFIRSTEFYQVTSNAFPIITLGNFDQLTLKFDDLQCGTKELQYKIYYYDASWKPTNILVSEYVEGMLVDYVNEIKFSQNSYVPYTHYELKFPNQNMNMKLSGNYLIVVFLGDEDHIVLSRRFYVYENLTDVAGKVDRASYPEFRNTKHEIDFTVLLNNLNVPDPFNNIKVVIKQNWRKDNEISTLKPNFVEGRTLRYNYEDVNLFDASNEFRFVDVRDFNFRSQTVKQYFFDTIYNAILFPDEDRSYKTHVFIRDQNGNFTIAFRRDNDIRMTSIETDYFKVFFTLKPAYQDQITDTYIFGGLSNWQIDEKYKMTYNKRKGQFEHELLLKQGIYDYMYVTVDKDGKPNTTTYEGNHWDSEQNYLIFVYYRPLSMPIDQLVGYKIVNSNLR
jgi:hypothetical protein